MSKRILHPKEEIPSSELRVPHLVKNLWALLEADDNFLQSFL